MLSLKDKRILLGVTGGIAAYKSAEIVRQLQAAGADVRVVMTKGGQAFITPLTMQALTGYPVRTDVLGETGAESGMSHIELARWADCILVAPATANVIAQLACGTAADLLTTLCLARKGKLAIAPAMNEAMWENPATQANMATLRERGVAVYGPGVGVQACGDVGPGRMLEPAQIIEGVEGLFAPTTLSGKKVMITAGPTCEAIDPVRYLSNHSSGKMGYALAEAATESGAEVVLVSGPTALAVPSRVKLVRVESALDMHREVMARVGDIDIFIGAAAVADYRPETVSSQKMKKNGENGLTLTLVKNPDIVSDVASFNPRPYTVGFAAETENLEQYAKSKLVGKNLDMIVANDVSSAKIGFNTDQNAVTVFYRDEQLSYDVRSKAQLARDIIGLIGKQYR